MKPILKEIIAEFYLITEGKGKDIKPRAKRGSNPVLTKGDGVVPSGLWGSGRYYYKDKGLVQYAGTVDGTGEDRTWVPVAVRPKPASGRKSKNSAQPAASQLTQKAKPTAKAQPKAEPTTDKSPAIEARDTAVATLSTSKSKEVGELIKALNLNNNKLIKTIIDKYGFQVSQSGKLILMIPGVNGSKPKRQDPFSDTTAKKAATELINALVPYNIPLVGAENTERSSGYKPSDVMESLPDADVKLMTYGTSDDTKGFSVDKIEYPVYTRNKKQLVEVILDEIFLGKGLSKANATRQAAYVDDVIACHNQKIKFIGNALRGKTPIKFKEVPPGKQGAKQIAKILVARMIADKNLPDDKATMLRDAMDGLTKSNNPTEFNSHWGGFRRVLEENKAGLGPGAIPAICEMVEVIRKCMNNQRVLVPMSDTFTVVDVIAIGNPLKQIDVDNLEEVVDNIELISVLVYMGSVKAGEDDGAAASTKRRLGLTTFSSKQVEQDLTILIGGTSHHDLWTDSEEEFKKYNTRTIEVLTRNLKTIIEYYRLPPNSTIKTVMKIFETGNPPKYDNNGKYLEPGRVAKTFSKKPMSDMNRRQLHLDSIIGFMTDAIYNTYAHRQAFISSTYKSDKISVSDGYNVMCRFQSQFNKSIILRKPFQSKNRSTKGKLVWRGEAFYSKIIPTTREQMRTTK